jgi:hypothetical protein
VEFLYYYPDFWCSGEYLSQFSSFLRENNKKMEGRIRMKEEGGEMMKNRRG